jgi:hypothetical protein
MIRRRIMKRTEMDKGTVLKYFLMLNRTGKAMDSQNLSKVEEMLKEMR